jgi:UDP-glucose 4-epimerase
MNILILGSNSFLAQALINKIGSAGKHTISAVSRRPSQLDEALSVNFIQAPIETVEAYDTELLKADIVLYFASASNPGSSSRRPLIEVEQNIKPMVQLLDWLGRKKPKHLVYFSSGGTVYGDRIATDFTEAMVPQPISYYGAGKVACEMFLRAFQVQNRFRVSVVRPTNVYGAGQPYVEGFGLIRTLLEKVKQGEAINIWGDGKSVRDYLYITDFVTALEHLIDSTDPEIQNSQDKKNARYDLYNLSYGQGYSVNQVLDRIEQVVGKPLDVQYREGRSSDVKQTQLDSTLFRSEYFWKPQIDLKAGIDSTWQWMNQ